VRNTLHALARESAVDPSSKVALLIGCGYALHAPEQAREIVNAARALAGPVRLVEGCCGASLIWAGDRTQASRSRAALAASVADADRLIVADPGCALALRELSPVTLVDLAVRELPRLQPRASSGNEKMRWHDPCQLGRG
jgi:Fe-S oxidoreductase